MEKELVVKKWVVVNELGTKLANFFDDAETEILEQREKTSLVRLSKQDTYVDIWVPTSQILEVPKI